MWELDHKESWAPKNQLWCWRIWIVLLEKSLESPLDSKEIKLVNPKGNQTWIFIGRTDIEAEVPILWPPDTKDWLTGKDPDARKDWRQEEKGDRGWDGWMTSPTWWRWVWASSGSWWWIGKPGILQSMGLTEWLNWTESSIFKGFFVSVIIRDSGLQLYLWGCLSSQVQGWPMRNISDWLVVMVMVVAFLVYLSLFIPLPG